MTEARIGAPNPSPLSYPEIEVRAEQVAAEYQFDPLVEPISGFAERLGGAIEVLNGPGLVNDLESGSLVVRGPGNFTIYLSPFTGVLRDNFTIGHEVGHYFLHSGEPVGSLPMRVGRFGDTILERQANRFAAALLMPRSPFTTLVQTVGGNSSLLSGLFNVSRQAVEARIASLKL